MISICLAGCGARVQNAFITTQQLHIKYPIVESLKDRAVQDKINALIYSTTFRLRDENASALKKHINDYTYYVQSEVTLDRNDVLSIKFEECLSIPFYAHPFNAVYAITVNTKDGSVLRLNDLFKAGTAWKTTLNGILKKDIDEQAKKAGIPLLKKFDGIDNEQEFYLTKNGLVIYWQEAEYFPRCLGPLMLLIPHEKISEIQKEGSDLY